MVWFDPALWITLKRLNTHTMNPNHIPGWINQRHQDRLAQTLHTMKPNSRILEIGCGFGRSTYQIMTHMPENSVLHTVDTFEHLSPQKFAKKHFKHYKRKSLEMDPQLFKHLHQMQEMGQRGFWNHITAQHPRHSSVTAYQMTSVDYMQQHPDNTYDMVYLDGDHSYVTVQKEIAHYEHTDIMCGDDYGPAHPGVIQAVDELRSKHPTRAWQPSEQHVRSGYWVVRK